MPNEFELLSKVDFPCAWYLLLHRTTESSWAIRPKLHRTLYLAYRLVVSRLASINTLCKLLFSSPKSCWLLHIALYARLDNILMYFSHSFVILAIFSGVLLGVMAGPGTHNSKNLKKNESILTTIRLNSCQCKCLHLSADAAQRDYHLRLRSKW